MKPRWIEPPPVPEELLKYHYFPVIIDSSILRLGEQMSALDKPLTLRDLKNTRDNLVSRGEICTLRKVIDQLEKDLGTTDFVRVNFGGTSNYTYHVAEMPARRVKVGDLVTVQPSMMSARPQVVRVVEVNVPKPKRSFAEAVAISPEDAARIEASLGRVR